LPASPCLLVSARSWLDDVPLPHIVVSISRSPPWRGWRRNPSCRRAIGLGLFELRAFLLQFGSPGDILLAVEEDIAIDESGIDARVDAERMAVPDGQIGVFTDFN